MKTEKLLDFHFSGHRFQLNHHQNKVFWLKFINKKLLI